MFTFNPGLKKKIASWIICMTPQHDDILKKSPMNAASLRPVSTFLGEAACGGSSSTAPVQ